MAAVASANGVHAASARVSAVVRADVALASLAHSERARQFGAPPLLLTRATPPGGYDSDESDVACGAAASDTSARTAASAASCGEVLKAVSDEAECVNSIADLYLVVMVAA